MDLQKSLEIINDAVVQGNLDDNHLIVANKVFKEKSNFKETPEYKIAKSLSLNHFIRTGISDQNLMKALTLGETKVGSDGKNYIAVKTPSGVIDWRINKPKGNAKADALDDVFDNDDFPKSETDFTVQNKQLGGSTGAKLVTDGNGVEYVMKEGASAGHVKEEFLTNAIYKTMGFDTPEMKLYEGKGKTFLLSKFIPNAKPFDALLNAGDVLAMDSAKDGFVLDCLLGNWDVFKNDNILMDSNGLPVRVDNGGSLRYRAQGGLKSGWTNVVGELQTMLSHNQWLGKFITQDIMNSQIEEIAKKEKEILDLIDDPNLKSLMKSRIQFLKNKLPKKKTAAQKKAMAKGKYRDLTSDELQESFDKANGNLFNTTADEGWQFLSEVCKLRGFDTVPEVLEDADFDALLADKENTYTNRGICGSHGTTAKQYMNAYAEGEKCFYGTTGVHGQGIYSAVNVSGKRDKSDNAFYTASMHYANGHTDNVLDIIIPKNAKKITKQECRKLMDDEFFGPEFAQKKLDFDKAEKAMLQGMKDLDAEKDTIEDEVKNKLGWNTKVLDYLVFQRPEELLADTKKTSTQIVLNTFEKLVSDINGDWNQVDSTNIEITLPNSNSKFTLNTHDFDNALKQRNSESPVYNFRIERLKDFIVDNHFNKIKGTIDKEVKEALRTEPRLKTISDKIKADKVELSKIEAEVNSLKKNGSSTTDKIIGQIIKKGSEEMYGIFAAIKGYDVLIAEGGNGDCDYAVILNRSITKVRKFV